MSVQTAFEEAMHHETPTGVMNALIQQGVWHSFWTETGAIFEEISTTHFNDDSFYEDKAINQIPRPARKTRVNHWGRYQI